MLLELLRDPLIVVGATFVLTCAVTALVMLITNTRRWHSRYHVQYGSWSCDHCLRDRNLL